MTGLESIGSWISLWSDALILHFGIRLREFFVRLSCICLQGDLRHREKVGQLLLWRLVIDRRFHRLIYLFGREEHGRLHTGRAG